jgi:NAD(P)-dependent dehydrogenase (short-subunit alcohol dehydrogenase family)
MASAIGGLPEHRAPDDPGAPSLPPADAHLLFLSARNAKVCCWKRDERDPARQRAAVFHHWAEGFSRDGSSARDRARCHCTAGTIPSRMSLASPQRPAYPLRQAGRASRSAPGNGQTGTTEESRLLLQEKVALVTGAGRGIGRAVAMGFAGQGATVVVNDLDAGAAEETTRLVRDAGGRALCMIGSVSDRPFVQGMFEKIDAQCGRFDILVNNAGVVRDRMMFNMSEEEWDLVLDTHLKGTFLCSHFASRRMRERKAGRIINMVSRSGLIGNTGQVNYAAAKGGMMGFTLAAAMELGKYGVTVNALAPRAETDMTATMPDEVRARRDANWAKSSVRRRGTPEEVAPLAIFLASDRAVHLNGQIVAIGGDKLALWSPPRELSEAYMFGGWTLEKLLELFDHSVGFNLPSLAKKD